MPVIRMIGIGAGGMLAIVLIGVGGSLVVMHRRRAVTRHNTAAIG